MMLEKKILVLTLILVLITGAGIAVVQPHGDRLVPVAAP